MIDLLFNSSFCSPFRKADDTPSPTLPRVRNSLLWLHPWSPWTWGILDFCTIEVIVIKSLGYIFKCLPSFHVLCHSNLQGASSVKPASTLITGSAFRKIHRVCEYTSINPCPSASIILYFVKFHC
jgi:hypothetical protein